MSSAENVGTIAFVCPNCGAQLRVKENMAGKGGTCPGCRRPVQVPAGGDASGSGSAVASARPSGQSTLRPPDALADTAPGIPDLAPPPDYAFLGPAQRPDELGRLGPYRVLKVLGAGAMGIIFQAEDSQLKRRVALKVLKPSLATAYEFRRRFLREAQLAAAIDHEHVVTTYQVGEDRGVPFMAMQLLQGETLEDRLRRTGGTLPLDEVLRVGREIAEGLTAAHAGGLVHRDIKPANVWLEAPSSPLSARGRGVGGEGGRVKVLDFGLARGTGEDAHWTQAGAVIGTPAYMAPEQANAEEVDARCDLFSLGAVLYRAATGRLPFGDKDTLSILNALATRTPEAPHEIDPSLTPAFSRLVMQLLAKDRDERPQSAGEVARALSRLERGGPAEEPEEDQDAAAATAEEAEAPAAPPEEETEVREAARARVKRKARKKARGPGSRKKKRPEDERNWGWLVLVASLVFLAVAVLVLILAVLHRASQARAAASAGAALVRADRVSRPVTAGSNSVKFSTGSGTMSLPARRRPSPALPSPAPPTRNEGNLSWTTRTPRARSAPARSAAGSSCAWAWSGWEA